MCRPDLSVRYIGTSIAGVLSKVKPQGHSEERERLISRPVSFGPQSLQRTPQGEGAGHIDYRLARRHLVAEYKRGRLSRREVCDAHPELMRAARNLGEATTRLCPICEDDEVVLVSFVFGTRLPAHGRCVASREELAKLASRPGELVCYVVEVCPACSWNHLVRTFALGPTGR
jgi:uncharacterized protein DUF5318